MKIKTVSQQVKEFGAKVKRNARGWYTYVGKNFKVDFSQQQCEYIWWEAEWYADDVDSRVVDWFYHSNKYDTKKCLLGSLLQLDQELEKK